MLRLGSLRPSSTERPQFRVQHGLSKSVELKTAIIVQGAIRHYDKIGAAAEINDRLPMTFRRELKVWPLFFLGSRPSASHTLAIPAFFAAMPVKLISARINSNVISLTDKNPS